MRKLCGWLLALVMLCLPVLGLAEGIDQLPETYDELCAMLPDMPIGDPENVSVRFPAMGDSGTSNMEIYCDKAQWAAAMGQMGGSNLDFAYDEKIGAYVMDNQSQQKYSTAIVVGEGTGFIAIGSQDENGWVKNVVIYFDNEAVGQTLFDSADQWKWDSVTDSSVSNHMVAGVRLRKHLENCVLDVWQYADRTEAIQYDTDGNVVVQKTYPEFSEFCKQFMPLAPAA